MRKNNLLKKTAWIVLSAVLFGTVAGTVMTGIQIASSGMVSQFFAIVASDEDTVKAEGEALPPPEPFPGEKIPETFPYRPNNDSPLDYQNYFYQINSRFKTGDQVRIEVETKDGKYKANAEATVYEPIEIIKADTIESNHSLSETSESLWIYQATKWKIKLQTPTTNHSQYYRVNIKQTYTYHLTNRKTLQDSTAISTQWECSGYYDTALMDGKPGTPNNSDPIINFIPTINNYYNVFNDAYFTNNQYTMTLDSWYSFLLDNKLYKIKKITGKAIIQYYAISPAEYQYLRAANAYADHDSSNLLETPVIFPNNIKGGIGIFAIENPTETSIPLKSIEDY